MNVRELNDEQREQLDKTLEVWSRTCDLSQRGTVAIGISVPSDVYNETRKLQEMLQPPKQYLVQFIGDEFAMRPYSIAVLKEWGPRRMKGVWEWDNGTVGEPITGEPLRELLKGESK